MLNEAFVVGTQEVAWYHSQRARRKYGCSTAAATRNTLWSMYDTCLATFIVDIRML